MSKKVNQSISKRASTTKLRPQSIKKIREQLCVSGGEHSHWIYDFEQGATFTEEDGWHNHIFLIGGKLYSTEHDGSHRHPINKDGTVASQTRPHGHDLFIGGVLHSTELGGGHSHAERIEDGWLSYSGPHRHFAEVDGVTYESLLPDDILSVEIRKELGLGIQSVLFSKSRFLTFEVAAQKAEAMGLSLKKFEERQETFVFTQLDSKNFKEMSLQTITLEDGVDAVIGVLIQQEEPKGNDLGTSALSQSLPQEALGPQQTEREEEAFDDVQTQLTLGYVLMTSDQRATLMGVKDEIAKEFAALTSIIDLSIEPTTKFIDKMIEDTTDNDRAALCDRVNSGLVLLDAELQHIEFTKFEVEIEKDLATEIMAGTQSGVSQALSSIVSFTKSLAQTFKETSFINLQKLLNSVTLSSERLLAEAFTQSIEKELAPTDDMSREELRESQKEREEKFGIEIVEGSALSFPAGFPEDLGLYGDPVNLKFPFDTIERARNARVRFKQFANQIYSEDKSKKIVHERIVSKELELGVSVTIDLSDPLDAMLPASFRERTGVTVVEASAAEVTKNFFVPIFKQNDEERTVFGIVLEPNIVDLHGDTYDDEAVKNAAHIFMENFQNIKLQHKEFINDEVKILESFIAPTDMTIDTPSGPVLIKKNTWLMKVRILSDDLWGKVKKGEFTGFSIGAIATVTEREAA